MRANRGSRQTLLFFKALLLLLPGLGFFSVCAHAAANRQSQDHQLPHLLSFVWNPLAPSIKATIIPAPNTNGWNNTTVRVHFATTNSRSAWVTPDVIVSNETAETEVEGIAFYNSENSNTNDTSAFVRIDKTPPTLTLEAGNNQIFDDSYPLLVVDYSDGGVGESPNTSGLDMARFQSTLDGIGVTNLFYTFNSRAVAMMNHLAAGRHVWVVNIADMAGNVTIRSNTFTATGAENPNAPKISNLDLIDDVTATPYASIWVLGKVTGQKSIVTASVNGDQTTVMHRRDDNFGSELSLNERLTNVIMLVASDAGKQNRSARLAKVKVTEGFGVSITAPTFKFGKFTNGQSQTAKGNVSYRFFQDQTNILALASVKVNGILAVLSELKPNGDISWSEVVLPAPGCTNSIMPIIASLCWTGRTSSSGYTNLCLNIPLDCLEAFEIVQKKSSYSEAWLAGEYPSQTFEQRDPCSPDQWIRGDYTFTCNNEFKLPCSAAENSISTSYKSDWKWTCNKQEPDFEEATYAQDFQGENGERLPASNRGLSFGNWSWKTKYTRQAMGDGILFLDGVQVVEDGSLTFRTPFYLEPQYADIFTFMGVEGVALSNLMFEGNSPIAYDNAKGTVTYLLTLDGAAEYTISRDSFKWPGSGTNSTVTYEADDASSNGRHLEWHSEDFHRFSFSDIDQ